MFTQYKHTAPESPMIQTSILNLTCHSDDSAAPECAGSSTSWLRRQSTIWRLNTWLMPANLFSATDPKIRTHSHHIPDLKTGIIWEHAACLTITIGKKKKKILQKSNRSSVWLRAETAHAQGSCLYRPGICVFGLCGVFVLFGVNWR